MKPLSSLVQRHFFSLQQTAFEIPNNQVGNSGSTLVNENILTNLCNTGGIEINEILPQELVVIKNGIPGSKFIDVISSPT